MKRFFQRIRQKALDVREPPVLIVAFGDSNTQGVMEHQLLAPEIVYHRPLQRALEAFYPTTTFSTVNAGVSGDTACQALERLERDVVRHQPDLVLIAFGTNDAGGGPGAALETFRNDLTQLVTEIRRKTEADLVLLTPPFMATRELPAVHPEHRSFVPSVIKIQTDGTLALYAEAIREVSRTHEVTLADIHREWARLRETHVDTDLWLSNGLNHPDERGHRLAAQVILQALLSLRHADGAPVVPGQQTARTAGGHGT